MVARIARFEGVNVKAVESTMDEVDALVTPILMGLPGHQRTLHFISADGEGMSVSLFDSEENALAAERTFDEEMPRMIGEHFKSWEGRRVSADRYTVFADTG